MNNKDQQRAIEVSKDEKNKWKPINHPLTLKEALSRKSKADLNTIRKNLKLKGMSQLKKDELSERLGEQIPTKILDTCAQLDNERFQLLLTIASNHGILKQPNLQLHQISFFETLGLFYPGELEGEKVLVMPVEIMETFLVIDASAVEQSLKRNTEYIKLARGLLYYYGCMTFRELYTCAKDHMSNQVTMEEYSKRINDAAFYYDFMAIENGFIYHGEVESRQKLAKEIARRSDLGFRQFSKNELLAAADDKFIESNRYSQELVHYFEFNYGMSKKEANDIVKEIIFLVKNGQAIAKITELLHDAVEIDSLDTMNELMAIILPLSNHTRQWIIKGHMPVELRRPAQTDQPILAQTQTVSQDEQKKPGRNDKCICGSGKKYKKCCGR